MKVDRVFRANPKFSKINITFMHVYLYVDQALVDNNRESMQVGAVLRMCVMRLYRAHQSLRSAVSR